MTPHEDYVKREVGARELRARLSRYLRHVAGGGEVVVTRRGKRVARLTPVDVEDPLADLRERGLVQEPTDTDWRPRRSGRPRPSAPVAELVAKQRR